MPYSDIYTDNDPHQKCCHHREHTNTDEHPDGNPNRNTNPNTERLANTISIRDGNSDTRAFTHGNSNGDRDHDINPNAATYINSNVRILRCRDRY